MNLELYIAATHEGPIACLPSPFEPSWKRTRVLQDGNETIEMGLWRCRQSTLLLLFYTGDGFMGARCCMSLGHSGVGGGLVSEPFLNPRRSLEPGLGLRRRTLRRLTSSSDKQV